MKKKRLSDLEIKMRLRNQTLHFVGSANDRRRVLDIARIDGVDVATRVVSGGFAVLYVNGGRK